MNDVATIHEERVIRARNAYKFFTNKGHNRLVAISLVGNVLECKGYPAAVRSKIILAL